MSLMSVLDQHQFAESSSVAIVDSTFVEHEWRVLSQTIRSTQHNPSELFRYRVFKRAFDLCVVFFLLPVLLPLFFVISLVLESTSPGPVFFSHRRIRKDGDFFQMWKFRTMCVNSAEVLEEYLRSHPEANEEWLTTHKLKNDPRITRFGAFLRRTSLDELPQVWNVLNGTMSFVGPRPIVSAEIEKYGSCFDCYCRVKPGLTGLWQVSGRSKVSYGRRIALDCEYVQTWSLWRDFMIVLKTFSAVLKQDGAF
jgi:Undecaprenyl-phosphate galactose phosphotransferase WbaP